MSYGVGLRNGVAFALGTIPSLTSGGGLRPSLMLNFLSGSLDPRITFSRGTQAMQYGLDGTLQYAPNNLLTYSNQADNAAWTKSNSFVQTNLLQYSNAFTTAPWSVRGTASATANAITSPDGTNNGWLIAGLGALTNDLFQIQTIASGVSYAPSFWIKRVSVTGTLQLWNPAGTNGQWNINLALLSDNWERITSSHAAVTVVTPFAGSAGNQGGVHFLNNFGGTLSFYLYGTQAVQGSVPGDYVATTSAALPVLYADYNGALRARKLAETTANAIHVAYEILAKSAGVATYTGSILFKAADPNRWMRILVSDAATANYSGVFFDPATGTVAGSVVNVGFTGGTASITSLGSGWYRAILTTTTDAVSTGIGLQVYLASSASVTTYTGDGSSGIYIADAQLTPGYLPLAVTETTSAAVYGPRFDYDPSSLVTQNLLTYSQNLALYWVYGTGVTLNPTSIIAPDGTLTARTVNYSAGGGTEFLRNSTSAIAASVAQTFSFWAKSISGNTSFSIDLQNIEGTTVTLTSEWQRFTWTVTPAAARTWVDFQLGAAGTVALWGVQLNQGSTALPYTATTTAPYTLTTARGLLIEEQRTNLLLYSDQFDNAAWTKTRCSITANNATSPEGVANADKLVEDGTAASTHPVSQAVTVTAAAQTASCYLKAAERTWAQINLTGTANAFANFNLATGAIGTIGAAATATITAIANGWYRCTITSTTAAGANTFAIYPATGDNVISYNGDGVSGLYVYGAQLE